MKTEVYELRGFSETLAKPSQPSQMEQPMNGCGTRWHVLMVETGQELRLADDLQKRLHDAYVQTEMVWAGRDRSTRRALFPGYLFVTVSPGQTFGAVEDRPGALRFVRFDGQPAWVSMDLVETLRAAETLGAFDRTMPKAQRTALFRRGQAVRFVSGPWRGLVGNVERSARDRVRLLLDLLGRSVVVEVKEADLVPV